MDYLEKADELWEQYVPKSGQANTVQGELLREIEALRIEAQENNNLNFDEDFAYFCDFLWNTLEESGCIPYRKMRKVARALEKIRRYGLIAADYNKGTITNRQLAELHKGSAALSYKKDDLYDVVLEAVVMFCEKNPRPIARHKNPSIYR